MTNYAPNYTPRVRVEYVVDSVSHNVILRLPRDTAPTPTTAQDAAERWREAMSGVYGLAGLQGSDNIAQADIVGVSWAEQDTDLFLPVVPTTTEIIAGDDSGGGPTPLSRATLLSITGLTTAGGKITLYLWGARIDAGSSDNYLDWRFGPSELTGIPALWLLHFDVETLDCLASTIAGADGNAVAFFRQRINARISAAAINAARG